MAIHIISYELRKPDQDYQRLWDKLRSLGATRLMNSFWILVSESDTKILIDTFSRYVDSNDKLAVIKVKDIKTTFDTKEMLSIRIHELEQKLNKFSIQLSHRN